MSATACRPVNKYLSSALPHFTFTLNKMKRDEVTFHATCQHYHKCLHFVEEVRLSLAALKRLRDAIIYRVQLIIQMGDPAYF